MSKKVFIIGAGISGLSAGCYLQMNGYDTEIFELHHLPGGLCTSWKRGDYVFDGCIHMLPGSNSNDTLYKLWNEVADMKTLTFFDYQEYIRFVDKVGQFISIRTNLDELEKEFLDKAPEDEDLIKEFTRVARIFMDSIDEKSKSKPDENTLKEWEQMAASEFAKKFKNPLLKKTFESIAVQEMPILFLIKILVYMHKKNAGYPIGGSLKFARLMEKRYLDLGGIIHYKSRVSKILTKDNEIEGLLLKNDEIYFSDIVISAADGFSTIFDMLNGNYLDKNILDYYANHQTFPAYLQVSLGISRSFPGASHMSIFLLEKPLIIDPDSSCNDIGIRIFNFDPSLAPGGKTVITSILNTSNYKYWLDLRENNPEKYKTEKNRVADEVIQILEQKFGNIESYVEVRDISTPATVIRYTNNWKGSPMGWLSIAGEDFPHLKNELPGLKNFYMIGQWVGSSGLPGSLISGRSISEIICKRDKKEFTTSHY